jgi:membrane protease YdiL (CAAX protease family)
MIRKIFIREDGKVRAGWRLGMFAAVLSALLFSVVIVYSAASGLAGYRHPPSLQDQGVRNLIPAFLQEAAALACALLAVLFMYRRFEKRPFREFGYGFGRRWWRLLLKGFLFGAFLNLFWFLFLCTLLREEVTAAGTSRLQLLEYSALYLLIFLPAGFLEEAVYRGYLLQVSIEGVGKWPAIVGVSAFFGVTHLANPNANWLGALNITLWGIFLSYLCLRTRSLWAVSGVHWSYNFFEGVVFSAPVSGVLLKGRLLAVDFPGPRWLTGGAFGPEAGVVSIAMLLAALGIARIGFASAESAT